jgi:hypothetical protein
MRVRLNFGFDQRLTATEQGFDPHDPYPLARQRPQMHRWRGERKTVGGLCIAVRVIAFAARGQPRLHGVDQRSVRDCGGRSRRLVQRICMLGEPLQDRTARMRQCSAARHVLCTTQLGTGNLIDDLPHVARCKGLLDLGRLQHRAHQVGVNQEAFDRIDQSRAVGGSIRCQCAGYAPVGSRRCRTR